MSVHVNCCPLNGNFCFIPISHILYAFLCTLKVPFFQVACSILDYSKITTSKRRLYLLPARLHTWLLSKGSCFRSVGHWLVDVDEAKSET